MRHGPNGICLGAVLALLMSVPALSRSEALPAEERQAIESLIAAVEQESDATFIRNGSTYSAAAAGRFLRGKWRAHESGIRSAEEFIERVGSFSSTTGRPYLIRFSDGREMPSADFLRSQLTERRRKTPCPVP